MAGIRRIAATAQTVEISTTFGESIPPIKSAWATLTDVPQATALDAMPGCVLEGRYKLFEPIGQGAYSQVFRGQSLKLGIPVAVKMFHCNPAGDPSAVARRVHSEAVLLAQLSHPNVIRLWDIGVVRDQPYLVTEYVAGGTLGSLIEVEGRLDWRRALTLGRQVADALGAAYDLGVIHRDIKPDNVLVSPAGTAKLADLGLAVLRNGRSLYRTVSTRHLSLAGTVPYMAPEQVMESGRVDHRADMYALGATLYHAVTGRPPFESESVPQLLMRVVRDSPRPPYQVAPAVGLAASGLMLKLLSKAPEDRFPTYADLIAAIDRVIAG